MLIKKHRAKTAHIQRVLKKGVTRHSENFTLRLLRNSSPTVAVVISKKVAARAVMRNKYKRRIKTALRTLTFPKDTTLVFYAKKGISKLTITDIKKETQSLLK